MHSNPSKNKRFESAEKPDSCPACGSHRIAGIMYGKPRSSPQLKQKLKEGKIVLGGCCIGIDDPSWECLNCNANIHYRNMKP